MKRILSLLLALLLCALLCACGVNAPTTLAESLELPDNGIVSAETLSLLRDRRQVMTLRGETNGVAYTWTLFGTEITEPKDCNFALRRIKTGEKQTKLTFASEELFGFAPLLTVFLPKAPDADVASVYRTYKSEENYVCAAAVTVNEAGGAFSFSVANPVGTYVVAPERSAAVPAQTDADENEELTTAAAVTEAVTTAPQQQSTTAATKPTEKPQTTAATVAKTTTKAQPSATTRAPKPETTAAAATTTTVTTTEPQELTCTFSVECGTVFQHLEDLAPGKLDAIPPDGVIISTQSVSFTEGESVFDVLQRVCRENGVPMESSYVPLYNSAYVEGISNLYEFDCGEGSGWMYRVNGSYPNFGCSRYTLKPGDVVEFRYTCDLGADIGGRNNYS